MCASVVVVQQQIVQVRMGMKMAQHSGDARVVGNHRWETKNETKLERQEPVEV